MAISAKLRSGEFLGEDGQEGSRVERALVFLAVDEDGGCALDADAVAFSDVALDLGLDRGRVEGGDKLGHIEAEILRPVQNVHAVNLTGLLIEATVHGPELALLVGGEAGLGSEAGLAVGIEGKLFVDQADVFRKGLEGGFQMANCLDAVGALEIGEFDEGDAGVFRSTGGGAIDVDGYGIEEGAIAVGGSLHLRRGFESLADVLAGFGCGDGFVGERLAGAAGGVFDAALGELHGAATRAAEFAKNFEDFRFLGGGEAGEVHAGKIGGGFPILGEKEGGEEEEAEAAHPSIVHVIFGG